MTFTKDGELVCRHDQCDLHTTTNILVTPLASQCTKQFSPAEFDASGKLTKAASALCCASDLSAKLQLETVFGSQAGYAQAMINDYKAAGVSPRRVWAQSFNKDDVLYWVSHEPAFGRQAVFLDDASVPADLPNAAELKSVGVLGIFSDGSGTVSYYASCMGLR